MVLVKVTSVATVSYMSDSIKKLARLFSEFPTIGSRTANRFVFYLISQPKEKVHELIDAIQELKANVKQCVFCFNPYEGTGNLCAICADPSRIQTTLCVVEKEADLLSIENTKKYKGLYFILESSPVSLKKHPESIRIQELQERIQTPQTFGLPKAQFTEIILATNPTPEGKSISILIERALRELPNFSQLKATHLAKGLPVGGELEYADEETLESAFEGRK